MQNILLVAAVFLLSACVNKTNYLVGDDKENGIKAELKIDGDAGHLSIQYQPFSQWKPVNENVKILKHEIYAIEIQRPDGVKLDFVGGVEAPFICDKCLIYYKNKFPVIWYQK